MGSKSAVWICKMVTEENEIETTDDDGGVGVNRV